MIIEFEIKSKKFAVITERCSIKIQSANFVATLQQLRILHLKTEGLTNEAIGSHLGISSHTVKNHIENLMDINEELTGVRIKTKELTIEAYKYGLLYPLSIIGLQSLAKTPLKLNPRATSLVS